jgi:hypothetical protein
MALSLLAVFTAVTIGSILFKQNLDDCAVLQKASLVEVFWFKDSRMPTPRKKPSEFIPRKKNQGNWGARNHGENVRSLIPYAPVKKLSLSSYLWAKAMEQTDVDELTERPGVWID